MWVRRFTSVPDESATPPPSCPRADCPFQLHWLRKSYPDTPIDDLLKYTHSFRCAETALTQAGFRITGARLKPKRVYGRTSAQMLLGGLGTWFRADVDWRTYIARYAMSADEIIEHGHTFELMVAPFR